MRVILRWLAMTVAVMTLGAAPEVAWSMVSPSTSEASPQKKTTKRQQSTPKKKKTTRAEYEKQQRDLQKQIEATQRMISNNDQDVRAQSRDIQLREQEIGKRRALVVSMQQEIAAIREEEDSLQRTIVALTKNFHGKQKKYDQAIKHLYRWRSGYDELLFVLSASDLMGAYRRAQYLKQYSQWRKNQAIELNAEKQRTKDAKDALAKTKAERLALMSSVSKEKANLEAEQNKQNQTVNALKRKNKELQRALELDRKKQAEVEKQIRRLIQEEIKREEERKRQAELAAKQKSEKERKAEEERRRKEKAGGKPAKEEQPSRQPTYTPQDAKLTGSFIQNKGRMSYPVDTHYAILQRFNHAKGTTCLVLSTAPNAQARSIFEGTVMSCIRSSDDYLIIVNHGTYKSVYSNIQKPLVKQGDKVKTRQALGIIKENPDGKSGLLNFWIYKGASEVNPEEWLRR